MTGAAAVVRPYLTVLISLLSISSSTVLGFIEFIIARYFVFVVMLIAIQVLDKLDSPEKTGGDILINWRRQSGQSVLSLLDDKVFHLDIH